MIFLDTETRGRPDLTRVGAHHYWADKDSKVILLCWQDDKIEEVVAAHPMMLLDRLANGDLLIVQNLEFEKLALRKGVLRNAIDWDNNVHDTAAMARAMALPGSLDLIVKCLQMNLNLPVDGKDMEGRRIMLRFCKPDKDGNWYWDEDDYKKLVKYCKKDVELTKFIYPALRVLPPDEHRQMVYTVRMNERGVKLDMELAKTLIALAKEEKQDIDDRIYKLTMGAVAGASKVAQIKTWLLDETGEEFPTLGAETLRERLADEGKPLSEDVREVLELRLLGSKTSVSKVQKMVDAAHPDDHRLRGMFVFCGAGATGRWSSRIVQLHNLPRAGYKDATDNIIDMVESVGAEGLRLMFGNVMDELPKLIRSLLIAEDGKKFIWGDFAGIEARVLAWLAGDEKLVDMYRQGVDIYSEVAKTMGFEGQRQIGKTATLACGYGGGAGALASMASKFGLTMATEEQIDIVKKWRAANKRTTQLWSDLKAAAVEAMRCKNKFCCVSNHSTLGYLYDGYHLWCQLLSGRLICYPFAEIECTEDRFGADWEITAVRGNRMPKAGETEWPRLRLWSGVIVENVVQAISADLLRWLIEVLEENQRHVLLHVHDEILIEENQNVDMASISTLFTHPPRWASGLPLDIEWKEGRRYRK